jgi:uncharacterized protein YcbK (DUF882 family)
MLPAGRHFKPSEFACRDGTPYPETWANQWAALVGLCDAIREAWGGPLAVVSGYRSLAHNQALIDADEAKGTHGAVSGSYHLLGMAADLRPVGGGDASALHRLVLAEYGAGRLRELGGLGLYPSSNWIHVDLGKATDGHLRRWLGI